MMQHAYLFWYKVDAYASTEYVYIIALSEAQAYYFFKHARYTYFYDASKWPIDDIPQTAFAYEHEIGDIIPSYNFNAKI